MPSWLGVLGTLCALVVFLGSSVVYLKGSRDKGTIDSLERQNEAFTKEIAALTADVGRLTARVSSLERENTSLLAQRPSAEVISEIRTDLTHYIREQHDHNGEVRALLMAMAQELRGENK